MALFRCDACGVGLPAGSCKARIGSREFCGPERSPCHALGLLSASWLSEAEARDLLYADAGGVVPGGPIVTTARGGDVILSRSMLAGRTG